MPPFWSLLIHPLSTSKVRFTPKCEEISIFIHFPAKCLELPFYHLNIKIHRLLSIKACGDVGHENIISAFFII